MTTPNNAPHVPWIIRRLPHLITGAFVLVAIPVMYDSTFTDVSPAQYDRLAVAVEAHPELATDVAEALLDDVITPGEFRSIDTKANRLASESARQRLLIATENSIALSDAMNDPIPLTATP